MNWDHVDLFFPNNLSSSDFNIHGWSLPESIATMGLQSGDFLMSAFFLHLLFVVLCK